MYPHPVTEYLNISLREEMIVVLSNSNGQEVHRKTITETGTVYVGDLPSGTYNLSFLEGNRRVIHVEKVIIK